MTEDSLVKGGFQSYGPGTGRPTSIPPAAMRARGKNVDPPSLRLVGVEEGPPRPAAQEEPIRHASDPRWILARRVAEALDGSTLRPERRELLMLLGRRLGLTPFDCSLVIAIVQDQARRGYAPESCLEAAQEQLGFVPLPRQIPPATGRAYGRVLRVAGALAVLLAAEALTLWWLMS